MFRRLFLFACLPILSLLITGCFNDLDCLFDLPEEGKLTTIMEIKSNSDFDEFEILRTSFFEGKSVYFPYEFALHFNGYSDEIDISYFEDGIVNYGLNLDVYQDNLEFRNFEFEYPILDYSPEDNQVLIRKSELQYHYLPNSNDSLYLASRAIILKDLTSSDTDTLFKSEPVLIDSTKYQTEYFFDVYFDNNVSAVFLVTKVNNMIQENSSGSRYLESKNTGNYLLKVNLKFGTIDTLYKAKAIDDFDRPEFFANRYEVFLKLNNGKVISIDDNSNITELNAQNLPTQFNFDGSISIDSPKLYAYSHSTNEEIYFSKNFDQLRYAFPGKSKIAAIEILTSDSIYIYDITSKNIVNTIDFEKIPTFPAIKNEDFSTYEFRNPLLTKNDELIVMAIRKSYLLDADYQCYD